MSFNKASNKLMNSIANTCYKSRRKSEWKNQSATEHITEDEFYYKIVTNQEETIYGEILKLRKWTNSTNNITRIFDMDKTCFCNLLLN